MYSVSVRQTKLLEDTHPMMIRFNLLNERWGCDQIALSRNGIVRGCNAIVEIGSKDMVIEKSNQF